MEEPHSEFGKGFITCLVKFAEHFDKYGEQKSKYESHPELLKNLNWRWINGASDHLYDIECPEGKKWDKVREMITKLQNDGLALGHGCRLDNILDAELHDIRELTEKIALEIDKVLGLKPLIGEW